MIFELFDPVMDLRITEGKLPHWYQPGVTYFDHFRRYIADNGNAAGMCRQDYLHWSRE
jgi:hypothetical protein